MGKSIIEIDKYLASVHDTVTLISRCEDRDGVSARSIAAKVNDKGSLAGLVYRVRTTCRFTSDCTTPQGGNGYI